MAEKHKTCARCHRSQPISRFDGGNGAWCNRCLDAFALRRQAPAKRSRRPAPKKKVCASCRGMR